MALVNVEGMGVIEIPDGLSPDEEASLVKKIVTKHGPNAPKPNKGLLGDIGSQIKGGYGSGVEAIGQLGEYAGLGSGMKNYGAGVAERAQAELTPESQDALEQGVLGGGGLRALALNTASMAPQLAASLGVGALGAAALPETAAAGLGAGAARVLGPRIAGYLGESAPQIGKTLATGLGVDVANTGMAAGSAGSNIERQIRQLAQEHPDIFAASDEGRAALEQTGGDIQAAVDLVAGNRGASGALGTGAAVGALSAPLGPVAGRLTSGAVTSQLGKEAATAALMAGMNAPMAGAQKAIENTQVGKIDPSVSPMDDVLKTGAEAAISALPIAAAGEYVAGRSTARREQRARTAEDEARSQQLRDALQTYVEERPETRLLPAPDNIDTPYGSLTPQEVMDFVQRHADTDPRFQAILDAQDVPDSAKVSAAANLINEATGGVPYGRDTPEAPVVPDGETVYQGTPGLAPKDATPNWTGTEIGPDGQPRPTEGPNGRVAPGVTGTPITAVGDEAFRQAASDQRQAGEATARFREGRARAADNVLDTEPGGRPQGIGGRTIALDASAGMDQAFPIQIHGSSVSDGTDGFRKGTRLFRAQRMDPRTGAVDGDPYFVPQNQVRYKEYATDPRQAQDFAQRAKGPKPPEEPRMGDYKRGSAGVNREENQTYRATEEDSSGQPWTGETSKAYGPEDPGRGPGWTEPHNEQPWSRDWFDPETRASRPEQPPGQGPWRHFSSAEEIYRHYEEQQRARAEAKRRAEEQRQQEEARKKAEEQAWEEELRKNYESAGWSKEKEEEVKRKQQQRQQERQQQNQEQSRARDEQAKRRAEESKKPISSEPAPIGADGYFAVNADGHVISDKGGAIWFDYKDKNKAARMLLRLQQEAQYQTWELANHEGRRGFTIKESIRREKEQHSARTPAEHELPAGEEAPKPKRTPEEIAKAHALIKERLDGLRKLGAQGELTAKGLEDALNNRELTADQLHTAFQIADIVGKILPNGSNHLIRFLPKLFGNVPGEGMRRVEGKRSAFADGPFAGMIQFSLDRDLTHVARETAAHEAFHVIQDYLKTADPAAHKVLTDTFKPNMKLSDMPTAIRQRLQSMRVPGKHDSYWTKLQKDFGDRPIENPLEAQAYIFGALSDAQMRGEAIPGIPAAFRRIVNLITKIRESIRSLMKSDPTAAKVMEEYIGGKGRDLEGAYPPPADSAGHQFSARNSGFERDIDELGLKDIKGPDKFTVQSMTDSLRYMADVLHIPRNAMGLNGKLTLYAGDHPDLPHTAAGGFGARMEHEPEIIARIGEATPHEWFHSVDHDLGVRHGVDNTQYLTSAVSGPFLSQTDPVPRSSRNAMRQPLEDAWRDLRNAVLRDAKDYQASSHALDTLVIDPTGQSKYYQKPWEKIARAFEPYILEHVSQSTEEGRKWLAARHPAEFPVGVEKERIYAALDHFFNTLRASSREHPDTGRTVSELYSARSRQTETPEFKRWFGDSKVVDRSGEPLRVYHGTSRGGFSEFDTYGSNYGLMGQGSYFTDDPHVASGYTKKGKGDAPAVYPSYLSIKNPLDMDAVADTARWRKAFDGIEDFHDGGTTNESWYRAAEELISEDRLPKWEGAEIMQDGLRSMGHDGITHVGGNRVGGGTKHRVFIAFEPEQIKSATGNRGSFDQREPRIDYSARLSPSEDPRVERIMDATLGKQDERGSLERVRDYLNPIRSGFFDKAYQKVFDHLYALSRNAKELEKRGIYGSVQAMASFSAHKAGILAESASSYLVDAVRGGGIPVYDGRGTEIVSPGGRGLWDGAMKQVRQGNLLRQFQQYSIAVRDKRLTGEGRGSLGDKLAANGMTHDQLIKYYESRYPFFKDAQADLVKNNEGVVKYLKDTGVITPEMAARFTKDKDYISFYRQIETFMGDDKGYGPAIGGKNMTSRLGLEKLKGGTEQIGDFMENYVRNMHSAIDAGMRNVAANRALRDADLLGIAERVTDPSRAEKRAGNIVTVRENGKDVMWKVHDRLTLDALTGLDGSPISGPLAALRMPANVLRKLTIYNPGFLLFSHPIREAMQSWVVSRNNMIPVYNAMEGWKNVISNAPSTKALKSLGGAAAFDYGGSDSAAVARHLTKELDRGQVTPEGWLDTAAQKLREGWGMYEKLKEASDLSTRDTIFRQEMERHGDKYEAVFASKDQAVNFNRSGSSTTLRAFAAVVPFMNARIQGLDVVNRALVRDAKGLAQGEIPKTFMRLVGLSVMSAYLYSLVRDDPVYKAAADDLKDLNWIIPIGDKMITLPIPFEAGLIGKVLPERILRSMTGDDLPADSARALVRGLYDILRLDPIPQAVKPLVDIAANQRSLSHAPIESRALQDLPPEQRFTDTTSEIAKRAAALPIYPDATSGKIGTASAQKIDYLLKAYLGTIGTAAIGLSDKLIRGFDQSAPGAVAGSISDLPLVGRILRDPALQESEQVRMFYELRTEADSVQKAVSAIQKRDGQQKAEEYKQDHAKILAVRPTLDAIAKMLSGVNAQVSMIRNAPADKMSPDQKRDRLATLNAIKNNYVSRIDTMREMVKG